MYLYICKILKIFLCYQAVFLLGGSAFAVFPAGEFKFSVMVGQAIRSVQPKVRFFVYDLFRENKINEKFSQKYKQNRKESQN